MECSQQSKYLQSSGWKGKPTRFAAVVNTKEINRWLLITKIKVALLPPGITERTKMWLRNVGHQIPKVFSTAVSRSVLNVKFAVAHEGEKKPDRHHLRCGRAPCPRYLPHAVPSVWTQQKQTCRFGYPGVQELQKYHSDDNRCEKPTSEPSPSYSPGCGKKRERC